MTPASTPKMLEDGTYAKPKSKTPKGYDWCAETGLWVPEQEEQRAGFGNSLYREIVNENMY